MYSQRDMLKMEERRENVKKILCSETSVALPIEIITEILTWLPVKSVIRFKAVSNKWRSLIQQWPFIYEHWERGSHEDHFFKKFDVTHCCGIFLEKFPDTGNLRVRNPSTHQVLDLPNPCWNESTEIIYMLPSSGTFKVVSVNDEGWAVLALGGDDLSWRILKTPGADELDRSTEVEIEKLLSISNSLHCVKRIYHRDSISGIEVESFDMETECLTRSPLPSGFFSNLHTVRAKTWDSCIALTSIHEKELRVLVLEDHKISRWGTRLIIIPLKFMDANPDMKGKCRFTSKKGDNLTFILKDRSLIMYDIESGEIIKRKDPMPMGKTFFIMRPSIVSLKGMRTYREEIVVEEP